MKFLSFISAAIVLLRPVLASRQVVESLHGVPRGWVKTRDANPSQPIRLRIALEQPNLPLFEQKLYDVSTPQHPLYGKHLTREEVKDLMKPRVESTSVVLDWLKVSGIPEADIEDAGEWINFRTNVSTAGDLLGTDFGIYKYIGTDIERLRTLRYQVPSAVRPHITMIQPTTRFGQMRHQSSLILEVFDKEDIPAQLNYAGEIPGKELDVKTCNQAVTPECLRVLYKVGDTIADRGTGAILGIGGFLEQYAKHEALGRFFERFASYAIEQNFTTITIDGGLDDQEDIKHDDTEANLDIQYAAALGFDTDLRYYSTGGRGPLVPDLDQPDPEDVSNEPYLSLLTYMSDLPDDELPHTLSISYGEDEQSVPKSYAEKELHSHKETSSSGPGSACQTNDGNTTTRFLPTFPAACPYVTAVGGTERVEPESAASFSSGGFSDIFDRPLYQSQAVKTYLTNLGPDHFQGLYNPQGRGFPDIAAQAVRYSVTNVRGTLQLVGGTSAAAPTIAGLVSLLNSARLKAGMPALGFLNPWIYAPDLHGAFTDITTGGSKGCNGRDLFSGLPTPVVPGAGWNATEGWDPVTGLGTPLFDRLLELAAPGVKLPTVSESKVG
ncbi:putative tripeptidyl-peptidase 1 protein [Eutypa lata UCREL1]|uniref:tripeptidyl-peptidase II n=1 Tax=Eutypa lata (strain UCR-EL1) TaxID=1287681 RepID=M7T7B5_EUTLA|nr:putative tripeptidyl-peptidase 1 protein [Eutypa lata UCREL1]